MRKTVWLLVVFIIMTCTCALNSDKTIKLIDDECAAMNSKLKNYEIVEKWIWDECSDGAKLTGYTDKKTNKLVKIQVVYYGEGHRRTEEIFFIKNGYMFFRDELNEYNRPYFWSKEKAKQFKDTEAYDPEKSVITVDRFYFSKHIMIRWLNKDGVPEKRNNQYRDKEKAVLTEAAVLKADLKKKEKDIYHHLVDKD